jgi:hypothetical protein
MKQHQRGLIVLTLLGWSALPFGCGKDGDTKDDDGAAGSEARAGAASASGGSANRGGGSASGGSNSAGGSTGGGNASGGTSNPGTGGTTASGGSTPVGTAVNVFTQHNDIARSGHNLQETQLTPSNVKSPGFGKLFTRKVDDEIYTQPLYVNGVEIPGKGKHNVVYVATVNNTVYAFDADDAAQSEPLWSKNVTPAGARPPKNTDMTGAPCRPYVDFSGNIGIVGTPVIDQASQTMYFVARTVEAGKHIQRLHAVSILDGTPREKSPVVISASVSGTGRGNSGGKLNFDPLRQNQRSALLLLDGTVYIAWAGHCDWRPYHGWMLGYDAQSLAQNVVYNTTPDGDDGGIWQSGQGPSSDGTSIYVVTGNGTIGTASDNRSTRNRAHSFLKLSRQGASLNVDSWFTPYNYEYLNDEDLDLGSAGLTFVPGTRLAISGGKGGWLYVVDRDKMGGLANSTSADNNVVQTFAVNDPFHIHGSPLFWQGPKGGRLFIWAEEDYLKAYTYLGEKYAPGSKVFDVDNVEQSSVRAPSDIDNKKEMPGGILSLSANGMTASTAVLWASMQYSGDANNEVRPGILRAFDAENIKQELWNSRADGADSCGNYAKFAPATVANGRVYLSSFSKQLCVYGLR